MKVICKLLHFIYFLRRRNVSGKTFRFESRLAESREFIYREKNTLSTESKSPAFQRPKNNIQQRFFFGINIFKSTFINHTIPNVSGSQKLLITKFSFSFKLNLYTEMTHQPIIIIFKQTLVLNIETDALMRPKTLYTL